MRLWLALLFSPSLFGAVITTQITEDFSKYNADTGTTAVWNILTKTLQAPFVFDLPNPGPEDGLLNIGTGQDGPFNATTMASFDVNQGSIANTVTLDTSRFYQFTTFTLPQGTTLKAKGSAILQIAVLGNADVEGIVDVSGADGGPSSTTNTAANGGAGTNGGGAGGSGASPTNQAPSAGAGPTATLGGSAGGFGAVAALGSGGGGGGHEQSGLNGTGGSGGALGGTYGDFNLVNDFYGGSGGGGGGGNGNEGSIGGGGGGGGGRFSIQIGGNFTCGTDCQLLANGGNGGNATGSAGAGGGGSGGALLIYGGGTGANFGSVLAMGGNGGTAASGNSGGTGGVGINQFGFNFGYFSPFNNEDPNTNLSPSTRVSVQPYVIVSKPYDTQAASPTYVSITKTQTLNAGDTVTYQVAGSNDGFVSSNSGYVPEAQFASLSGYRYFRFRTTITSGSSTTSPLVQKLVFNYSYAQPTFHFSLTGCARVDLPSHSAGAGTLLLLVYFFVVTRLGRRFAKTKTSPTPQ